MVAGFVYDAAWQRNAANQIHLKLSCALQGKTDKIADELGGDPRFGLGSSGRSYLVEVFASMRSNAKALRESAGERRPHSRRFRQEDDQLIQAVADLYRLIGGRVAISDDGPFARFPGAFHDELPRDRRAASQRALIRRATALLKK